MVLSISILAYDGDQLSRGDVVPLQNRGRFCEAEESGEEFGGDVDGESSAHFDLAPDICLHQSHMIIRMVDQCNLLYSFMDLLGGANSYVLALRTLSSHGTKALQ